MRVLLLIFGVLLLSACGGGGSSSSDDGVAQGVFLDSAVEGLSYQSGEQSGSTDASGRFSYQTGATVTFKLGDILLGTAAAEEVMTPISLVPGASDETNAVVTNIVSFLLTMDEDGNPDNGIQISADTSAKAVGQSLDFTLSSSDFANDANVINAVALLSSNTLVTPTAAQNHLKQTLLTTMSGIYNGTFSGDLRGTWTIEVSSTGAITGSGCNKTDGIAFPVSGSVASDGAGALGFAGDGQFEGNFNLSGDFSGSWSAGGGSQNGTFGGSKAGSASGGSC